MQSSGKCAWKSERNSKHIASNTKSRATSQNNSKADQALAHHALTSSLQKPRQNDLNVLRACLQDPALPDYLLGQDSGVWDNEETRYDLVALNPVVDIDHVSLWLIKMLLGLFHRFFGRMYKKSSDSIFVYEDKHLRIPVSVLSTVLASLLPIASIVVL